MGRKAKPLALKLLDGNPGRQKLPESEPSTEARDPGPPKWLTHKARLEWRRIAPHLEDMGILQVADQTSLGLLCEWIVRYLELRDAGARPSTLKSCTDTIRALCAEYGLTPASRAKMALLPRKSSTADDDPLAFSKRKLNDA